LQAEYRYRISTNNMDNVYVKNNLGQPVPLNSLVKTSYYKVPAMVERFNDYLATQEIIEPNKGYTSGDIMSLVVTEMGSMPIGYNYEWFGSSYMQNNAQQSSTLAFVFSLCMIYLVLSALYEMWRLPLVVLMGVPFALFGSGIMLLLRNQPNDLYFQISLITLLGLSAKNIILLIEFALKHLEQGYSAKESALYALKVRFRPIVMTSITFIMGALPLIFATGAGANAEHSVGTGIIGGMIGSVILGTLFVPSYFVLIMHNFKRQQHDV
jgi:multidrug efflux pump